MTTRRTFLWACGAATAGTFGTGGADRVVAASGWRATSAFDAVTLKELAEQTREVLATMTPREEQELRMRYGIG